MATITVIHKDGTTTEHPLTGDTLSIGRSKDNDIVVADNTASRNHAVIRTSAEGHMIEDLESFNGTKVNGKPVRSCRLRNQDEIRLGETKLIFSGDHSRSRLHTDSVILAPEGDREIEDQKVVDSSPQASYVASENLLVTPAPQKLSSGHFSARSSAGSGSGYSAVDISSLERTNKVLFVLYEISRQLNYIQDFDELLKKIMDLIFMVVDADYGFLILTEGNGDDDLVPVVVKHKDEQHKSSEPLKASRTIIKRVINDKVALLTSNAMDDSRLDSAKSVFIQQIRSAMCVPLWKKDTIIGVIQLDSVRPDNHFTKDDLELLKAIGSQMAMVIEQASLNEQIRAEEAMRSRLERFHSPQVIEMILQGTQETKESLMEPKEVTATILFTDIIGFTGLAEKMPPRETTMLLNRYFSRMTDIVFTYDGTLDKYIGDGMMAVFGAPMQKDDDAERAIRAAIDMRAQLAAMKDESELTSSFNIRIGINTGPVVAGNIGSLRRLEYTVIGDVVNTASRLESIAGENQILIGEDTYRLVQDRFSIRKIGPKKVKGKSTAVMTYEVLGSA